MAKTKFITSVMGYIMGTDTSCSSLLSSDVVFSLGELLELLVFSSLSSSSLSLLFSSSVFTLNIIKYVINQ